MLYQYVQYDATSRCYHIITSVLWKTEFDYWTCTNVHTERSDILNSLPFRSFSLFVTQSTGSWHIWLLAWPLASAWRSYGSVMFIHVLLVFLPFLFTLSNFFSSSSKHKNVRLLLVLIIILEVSIQMMMMIIHMMMVWCQKTWTFWETLIRWWLLLLLLLSLKSLELF